MPNKTEEYLALAQRTANGLTRYWESWTDYLTTASRLYKYPFADQLMIYAQRPDATACADFDIWNNRMNRYVRRGAKGIALLDESSGFPRLHYVFDVSDTGVRRNSRDPEVWQYNDDLKQPVSEMLNKIYGISGERVSQQLADVAGKLVADYPDYRKARNEMQELVRAQKNIERFLQRKRTPPRKHRHVKKVAEELPSWEASSADFLVYIAVFRSNAPVTRIFSPRSFRVLRRAEACTAGSGTYTVHRQHKRPPASFSPQYRRCTVQCVPGPCRFARHAPSD